MRSLLVSLPVLVLACGGTIGPIDPNSLHIEGSYDFVIGTINIQQQQQQPYTPPDGHPAIGQHARLDIRKTGTTYEAALTPDFGDPAVMTVSVAHGDVTLTGTAYFRSDASGYAYTDDELETIHLGVGGDGKLDGTFTAEGQESILEGDVGWENPSTISGSLGSDTRAPQVNASPSSATVPLLPWNQLSVRSSEPLDATALQNALVLSSTKGNAGVAWTQGSNAIDWLGSNAISGYRTSWSDFSGDATFSVAAGLTDPSGNASPAVTSQLHFLDVPVGAKFDGATPPAFWGAAKVATSADSCGTASSCIEIGPLTGPCNADVGGLAARLTTNGATKISITYRTRGASQYGQQPYFPAGLGLGLATPGTGSQAVSDPSLNPTFVATNDTTYPYATDWVTAVIPLPQSASEVGVSFSPFANATSFCGGGPAVMPVTLLIDIAEITTAP